MDSGRGRYWSKVQSSVIKPKGASHKHLDGLLNIQSHSRPATRRTLACTSPVPHKHMLKKSGHKNRPAGSDRDLTGGKARAERRDSLVAKEFRRDSFVAGEPKRKNSRSNSIGEDDTVHIRKGRRQTMLLELRKFYDHRDDDDKEEDELEGDTFYTDKALLQRESLRFDTKLAGILTKLYNLVDSDGGGQISKQEYFVLNRKLYLVLKAFWDTDLPDLSSEETDEIALQDWNLDRDGRAYLNKTTFALSMFQLCDVWTEEIDKEEYCKFLDGIYDRISIASHPSGRRVFKTEDQLTSQMQVQMAKHARQRYEDGTHNDSDGDNDADGNADDTLNRILALKVDDDGLWHVTPEIMALCGKSLESIMTMDRMACNQFLVNLITSQFKDRKTEWRMPVGRVRKALKKLRDAERKSRLEEGRGSNGRRSSKNTNGRPTPELKEFQRRKTDVPKPSLYKGQSQRGIADENVSNIVNAGRHTTEAHKKAKDFMHGQMHEHNEYMDGSTKWGRDASNAGGWRTGQGEVNEYLTGLGGGFHEEEKSGRYVVDGPRRPSQLQNVAQSPASPGTKSRSKRRNSYTHGNHGIHSPTRRLSANKGGGPVDTAQQDGTSANNAVALHESGVRVDRGQRVLDQPTETMVKGTTSKDANEENKQAAHNTQYDQGSQEQGKESEFKITGKYEAAMPNQILDIEAHVSAAPAAAREYIPRPPLQPYEVTPWLYASKQHHGRSKPASLAAKLPVMQDSDQPPSFVKFSETISETPASPYEPNEREEAETVELPPMMGSIMSSASILVPLTVPAPPFLEPSNSSTSVFGLYAKIGERRFSPQKSPEKPTTFSGGRPLKPSRFSVPRLHVNNVQSHTHRPRTSVDLQMPTPERQPFYWRTAARTGGHLTKSNIRQINWQPHYENEVAFYDDDLIEKRSVIHYGSKSVFVPSMIQSNTAR